MSTREKPKSWKERRQSIKPKWLVPLIFPEWLCERFSYFLERWAFLDILGHIGRLTILIAVITYFMGADERRIQAENQRKAKQYQAWQVINLAQGKRSGGGRKDALEDLYKDKVPLLYIDISQAFLPGLNLAGADLYGANLAGAELADANLAGAGLADANLTGARLRGANLAGAELILAKFAGAGLADASLAGADLSDANLAGAELTHVSLARADLTRARLKGIRDWRYIETVEYANIYDVKNPPDGFIDWAVERGALSIDNYDKWKDLIAKKRQEQAKEKQLE